MLISFFAGDGGGGGGGGVTPALIIFPPMCATVEALVIFPAARFA